MNNLTIQNPLAPQTMPSESAKANNSGSDVSFGDMLKDAVRTVDRLHHEADTAITDLTTGRETDIHRTMVAMEKADISFQLAMQVRNKLVTAYEEIMRMQV